ncbi:MAG: flagellar hook-basal body complex protein [Candidatus Sericytochromatia bacterium]
MGNLSLAGINSLQAMNQWISVIDTNITNSKRTGYKETRVSFASSSPDNIGIQFGTLNRLMQVPSSILQVSKTQILDSKQGMLTPTDTNTDFALSGKGYFVVEDEHGRRYATRDGEFNFNSDGYLVTAQGLKVLSTGQDYIRVPSSEAFNVNSNGASVSPDNRSVGAVNTYSQSLYGNRKLMVVQMPNPDRLYYSKYGFTTFELGDYIPVDIENNFSDVVDGLSPHLVKLNSAVGVYDNYETQFFHNKVDGTYDMRYDNGAFAGRRHASLTAHSFGNFVSEVQFGITDFTDPSFGFTFGKTNIDDTLTDVGPSLGSGIFAGIVQSGGNLILRVRDKNSIFSSVNLGAVAAFAANVAPASGALSANNTFKLSLLVNEGRATVTISGPSIAGGGQSLVVPVSIDSGFVDIGTADTNLAVGAMNGDLVRMTNISAAEFNKTTYNGTKIIGRQASYNTDPLAKPSEVIVGLPRKDANGRLSDDQELLEETLVMQQHLEESTSTLADNLPILSNAQKIFSALSKLISVSNSITDDMNNMIR